MKKKKIITIIILLIGILYYGIDEFAGGDLYGPYQVLKVVDGDTIVLDIGGTEERVRLIGIDTPESVHPDKERNVPYGKIASKKDIGRLNYTFKSKKKKENKRKI